MSSKLQQIVAKAAALFSVVALTGIASANPIPAAKAGETQVGAADDIQDFVYLGDNGPVRFRLHVRIAGRPFLAVWQEFVRQAFKQFDTNGDGTLNMNEVQRMPPALLVFGGGPFANLELPSLGQLDSNKDGKVSVEELGDYFRGNGGAPFRLQLGPAAPEMVRTPGQPGRPPTSADAYNETLFNLLDTNGDGKLSREELAAAPAVLLRRDDNDDEMVSAQELLPVGPFNAGVVQPPPQRGAGLLANGPNFVATAPGESRMTLARQLQRRYAQPGSKKLKRQHLGLDEQSFKQLDADEDGLLDLEELAHFNRLPPNVEVIVRLGDGTVAGLELVRPKASPGAVAASIRVMKDGSVNLDVGAARLALQARAGQTAVGAIRNYRETLRRQFQALDRDGNGYLDVGEAQQNPFFRSLFPVLDRDGDGKLFEKELFAYLDELDALQVKARNACVSLTAAENGRGLFDLLDTDRDGRLGVREMRNAVKLLDGLDRDGDGHLSRAEIPRGYQLNVGLGMVNPNQPQRMLVDVLGRVQQAGVPRLSSGPLWFRKMDRNADGDVSRREFLGTDEEFAAIDSDGDGLISLEEAERADARYRQAKKTGP